MKIWQIIIIALLLLIIPIPIIKSLHKPAQPPTNYVTGYQHIYKGQILNPLYYPSPLIKLSMRASYLHEDQYLAIPAKLAIENLIADAEKAGWCLTVASGYRSPQKQQKLYNNSTKKEFIALPYESEHQTGLAVDFEACPMKNGIRNDLTERKELTKDFNTLPEYNWLKYNAERYGFEESFRLDNVEQTGFPAEPWHWKFIYNN